VRGKALIKFWERNFVSKRESCLSRQINGRALNNVCIVNVRVIAIRGGGGAVSCSLPGQQSPRSGKLGGKICVLKKKMVICTQQILNYWDEYLVI
jgi:hypothetical protein